MGEETVSVTAVTDVSFEARLSVTASTPAGELSFSVVYADSAGLAGVPVTATTDGSPPVIVSMASPTLLSVSLASSNERVAVARALINNPAVVFADEPSGNLDSESAEQLHQLFFKLRDRFGQTFVIVTHNHELAEMADRKITMVDGLVKTV